MKFPASSTVLSVIAAFMTSLALARGISAQTILPNGFAERQYATGLTEPVAMAFAPDPCPASGTPVHRLFVTEKAGTVRVFRNGVLQPTPFLTVAADTRGERGLDGICFDPNFASNGYVYVFYTILPADLTQPTHNRVSRFTADPAHPDVALAGSETRILDLPDLFVDSYVHNGAALRFGLDGKLYISTGENANPPYAQNLGAVFGKILRINPVPENADGTNPPSTFPTDNPFYNTTTGLSRAIYALGFRNPYTFAFQPETGRIFVNDVGNATWEEINDLKKGGNYGWGTYEGPIDPPIAGFINPLMAYHHYASQGAPTTPLGCAITGGDFYNPPPLCSGEPHYGFPASYVGKYFFLDFCSNWIYVMDPQTIDLHSPYGFNAIAPFATGIHGYPVYLTIGPDANLYYLSRTDGAVYQIRYPASLAPSIGTQPTNQLVGQGWPATFSIDASGAAPLSYQWQRGTTNITGANSPTYTLSNPQVATDNGATFRCVVTNTYGTATSQSATLTVIPQQPPTPKITLVTPRPNHYYEVGDTMSFTGSANDPQDGQLPPSAFTWQILFEHHYFSNPNHHTHPFFGPTSGISGGSVTLNFGETDPDVWYRVFLTATNSYGLSQTTYTDAFPMRAQLSLKTSPAPWQVKLDSAPKNTPFTFWGVVNATRNIGVDTPQVLNGIIYDFYAWSDGGDLSHDIITPVVPAGSVANYVAKFWKRPGYGSITANPNPIEVTDGSGAGATNLFWSSGQTKTVEVHYGAPWGSLLARTGPGSFSIVTNNTVRDGSMFYLQDVTNNQPLTPLYTLDSVTVHVTNAAAASITADPNPFVPNSNGVGQTTIAWESYGISAVEIHINAPNGPGFAGSPAGAFSTSTGQWVTDGMTFYLQNVSNGLPLTSANTLATVTLHAVSTPAGSISAQPNPFTTNSQGVGQTTLTWTCGGSGLNQVEIHVNAPNGPLFSGSGPGTFSAPTGLWVSNGMTFYLQNVSGGLPLTSANTLATVTMVASP